MEYHNFVLGQYFKVETVDYQVVLDECLRLREVFSPLLADVPNILHDLGRNGKRVMFEGAQGALLDIDLGHLSVCNIIEHHSGRRSLGQWRRAIGHRLCAGDSKSIHHPRRQRSFPNGTD